MTITLVDRAGEAIANRTSRRGFLNRSALVGTALAAAPATYILRPGDAYGAICSCNGQSCACGSTCCDGYTEFCCTMTGENTCPTGTIPAGWWKVDGSSFCTSSGGPGPRYYLDCNAIPSGPCGPSGVTKSTDLCDCSCADGDCTNRKACCTAFRYGQCNQQVACLGPIVCRVVTCTPPWRFDPTCTTAAATDNNTRWHQRPCLDQPTPERGTLPASFENGTWVLGYSFGRETAVETRRFSFGVPGDIPVVGDWNGDGTHTVGVVRGSRWLLRNSNEAGPPDYDFNFGTPGDIPIVGDWNGNGVTGVGMVRKTSNRWRLRTTPTGGRPHLDFRFGIGTDIPVVGDWNGNGVTGIGVVRRNADGQGKTIWLMRSTAGGPEHQREISFGGGDVTYLAGDWDGSGKARPAFIRKNGRWRFRGIPARGMRFGGRGATPLLWKAGDWTPGQLPTVPK